MSEENEDIQSQIDELVAANEALAKKNRQLLGEAKAAKARAKGLDIDPEEHAMLQQELETLRESLDKAQKTSAAEMEKLQNALTEKDGAIQNYLIDNGLSDALIKANVRPEMMGAVKAMLRQQTSVKAEGSDYQALMGDRPLIEAVTEWAQSDAGKPFVVAPDNSGGGAAGGAGSAKIAPKGNLSGDKKQRIDAIKARFPDLD